MYQPMMDITPRHSMYVPSGNQLQMPAEFAEPLVNGVPFVAQGPDGDTGNTAMQGVMMEPTLDDNPDIFNTFFGFDDSFQSYHNNFNPSALVDFGRTFNHADGFDPMQTIPEVDAYTSSMGDSMMTTAAPMDASMQMGNMKMPEQFQHFAQPVQGFPAPSQPIQRPMPPQAQQFQPPPPMPAQNQQPISHNLFVPPSVSQQMPLRATPTQQPNSEQQAALDAAMQHNAILSLSVPYNPPNMNMGHDMQMPIRNMMPDPASLYPSPPDDLPQQQMIDMSRGPSSNPIMDLKPQMPQQSPSLKQPTAGMGARRPHRPAALGTLKATGRSTSYSSNAPMPSPKPNMQLTSPDQNLRRVRSSIGVLNGRITKGAALAQRSPMAFNFSGNPEAPRMAKQMSLQSLNAVAAAHAAGESLPITPLSPTDAKRTPGTSRSTSRPTQPTIPEAGPEAPVDPAWTQVPDNIDMGSTSVYSPQAATPYMNSFMRNNFTSPPRTPMDVSMQFQPPPHQMYQTPQNQMMPPPQFTPDMMMQGMPQGFTQQQSQQPQQYQQQQQMHLGSMPPFAPQVMPSWMNMPGAQFGTGATTPGEDVMSMFEASRRPSNMSYISPSTQTGGPNIHASPDIPSGHSRFVQSPQGMMQQFPDQQSMFYPMLQTPRQGVSMGQSAHQVATSIGSISPTQLVGSPTGMGMMGIPSYGTPTMPSNSAFSAKNSPSELHIHEYEPREPAESSKLPPRSRNPSTPKVFQFTNTTVDAYESSKSPAGK